MKKLLVLLLAAVMVFSMTAFGAEAADDPFADLEPITLNLGMSQNATDSVRYLAAVHFNELLQEKSNGKLGINILNGTVGQAGDLATSVSLGDVDMAELDPGAFISSKCSVLDAPGVFLPLEKSYELFTTDNDFMALINAEFESNNLHNLFMVPVGGRDFASTVPINSQDDLNGMIIRVSPNNLFIEFVNALGGVATPISGGETYLAMQQGVCTALEHSLDQIVSTKLYEVTKYIYITNYVVTKTSYLMNLDKWNSLPEAYQAVFAEASAEMCGYLKEAFAAEEQNYYTTLKDSGLEVYEELEPWFNEAIAAASDKIITEIIRPSAGDELVDAAIEGMK